MAEKTRNENRDTPIEQMRERFARRRPPLAERDTEPAAGIRLSNPVPRALLRVEGIDGDTLPPADAHHHRIPIGPHCWMLVGETIDAAALRRQLIDTQQDAMITDLGHGWTRIRLQGTAATEVLQHGIDLDLHPDAWPVGRSAATAYRTMPILLHAPTAGCFDVYTLRSFAECLWEWIVDAAAGIQQETGEA